jgi:hypothetical protein
MSGVRAKQDRSKPTARSFAASRPSRHDSKNSGWRRSTFCRSAAQWKDEAARARRLRAHGINADEAERLIYSQGQTAKPDYRIFSGGAALAWIARNAPVELKATFFAVMASFINMALTASSLLTKFLNQIFIVTREVKDQSTGTVQVPADYSQLGWLLITVALLQ